MTNDSGSGFPGSNPPRPLNKKFKKPSGWMGKHKPELKKTLHAQEGLNFENRVRSY
jgi:hypothetical protein